MVTSRVNLADMICVVINGTKLALINLKSKQVLEYFLCLSSVFYGIESVCGNRAGMAGIGYGISFTELGKASVNGIFFDT